MVAEQLGLFPLSPSLPKGGTFSEEKPTSQTARRLSVISELDNQLSHSFQDRFMTQPFLSRQVVSYQGNKTRAAYRWFKYKEAFSASLVERLLEWKSIRNGRLLDPFAGMGTSLFAGSAAGIDAEGIELLPLGQEIVKTRLCLERQFVENDREILRRWIEEKPWKQSKSIWRLPKLRITEGAYPQDTEESIERYMGTALLEPDRIHQVLRFALLCVLEAISYTRKDGQYLRWDDRSGRRRGAKPFSKGTVLAFDEAVVGKLRQILSDISSNGASHGLFPGKEESGDIELQSGSCLKLMPCQSRASCDVIVTSPPYCNRYDYTRTYALELAFLGVGQEEITELRQQMLSCTVENRAKDLLTANPDWRSAVEAADRHELLQAVLQYLEEQKSDGCLNNNGIPRMVRGYFYEMACVIAECARVLKPGSALFMVNDNVRYAGASISVDLILSDLAEKLGFECESIMILANGKGNSSQQMGEHGRTELRKCVYVWRNRC